MPGSYWGFTERRTYLSIIAASALLGASPTASKTVWPDKLQERGTVLRPPIIPAQFRGHWSEDASACNTDPIDESQVWITASAVNLYETNGHVVRVTVENGRRAVVTLRSEGEGTIFEAKKGLLLSFDGKALTIRDEDDTGSSRFHLCRARHH